VKPMYVFAIAGSVVVLLLGMLVEYSLKIGIAPCHPVVVVDSLKVGTPDTVIITNTKTVVRRILAEKTDTAWLHDTLRILPDSLSVATMDSTMSDGARIGLTVKAVLIVHPVRTEIDYTPAPRIERTVTIPVIEFRTDWRSVTIGTLAGIATGMVAEKMMSR